MKVLPWSLHSMADALNSGAEEKIGHSGRDDKARIGKPKSTARNGCATGGGYAVEVRP